MPVDFPSASTTSYLVQGVKFEVDNRYKILNPMSHGSFGTACSAEDRETNDTVAVKKIESLFEHTTMAKRTLRELRILRNMHHENIMSVKNVFVTGGRDEFQDIYVVSELMETDLASTLRSSQELSDDHSKFFLYQILRGMKYVHSANVIHRNLKPRNLLVNANCDLRICDFGLARVRFSDREYVCPMTEYVCTRWYRAPEVLCSWVDYSAAIDIWSIGCIFAEIDMRKPLLPGHNTQHQLDLIIGLLGFPTEEETAVIPNAKVRKFINTLPATEVQPFSEIFETMSPAALELMTQMLLWDANKRITVAEALQHAYLEALHLPEDEPTRSALETKDFDFEGRKMTLAALREELFREALHYSPDVLEQYDKDLAEKGITRDISQYRLLQPGECQDSSDDEADDEAGDIGSQKEGNFQEGQKQFSDSILGS